MILSCIFSSAKAATGYTNSYVAYVKPLHFLDYCRSRFQRKINLAVRPLVANILSFCCHFFLSSKRIMDFQTCFEDTCSTDKLMWVLNISSQVLLHLFLLGHQPNPCYCLHCHSVDIKLDITGTVHSTTDDTGESAVRSPNFFLGSNRPLDKHLYTAHDPFHVI